MKKAVSAIAAVLAVLLAAVLIYDGTVNKETTADFFSMNTYVTAKLTGADSKECAEQIKAVTQQLDTEVLSRTSEKSAVYALNKNGGGSLDEKLSKYFKVLLEVCEKSEGAFDFTLGAVSDLWDFGGTPSVPDEEKLADALSHSGYGKLAFEGGSVHYTDKSAVIDFGAAGKGIALDEIRELLEGKRIREAVVSVGGSVLLVGDKEFTVGIRNPEGNSGSYIAKLHVAEGCVSTSGSYEQQFEQGGRRYHHILDPKTGCPVDNGIVSVTVISDSGILSDALSTACYVLGCENGFELARQFGCRAIYVTADKRVLAEENAADIIEITDSSYTLVTQ